MATQKVKTISVASLPQKTSGDDIVAALSVADHATRPRWLSYFVNVVGKDYIVDNMCPPASEPSVRTPATVPIDTCGITFPFVNREAQCMELLRHFYALEIIRVKAQKAGEGFSHFKRDIVIPLCTGIPGIGKSRFARVAVDHLTGCKYGASIEELVEKAEFVARTVWPEDGNADEHNKHKEFVESLLRATQARNFCVDLDHIDPIEMNERKFAWLLLLQWLKGRERSPTSTQSYAGPCARFMSTFALSDVPITIEAVIGFMLAKAEAEAEMLPSIIINVDNAQAVSKYVMKALLHLLLCNLTDLKRRVFVTLTGVHQDIIEHHLSPIRPALITLPLLAPEHIHAIVAHLFGITAEELPPAFAASLWWTGGVPRFVQYFLSALGRKAGVTTVGELWSWCRSPSFTMSAFTDAIGLCADIAFDRVASTITPEILDNLLTLAIAEVSVDMALLLTKHGDFTVRDAEAQQLVYLDASLVVRVPPVLLHKMHRNARTSNGPMLVGGMREPSLALNPDENDYQTVSILMHRLRAHSLLGRHSVMLQELLGNIPVDDCINVELPIPQNFSVVPLPNQLHGKKAAKHISQVRENAVRSATTTPVAFLNAEGSTCSYDYIVFPNFVLHIQERQRVAATRGPIVPEVDIKSVSQEYTIIWGPKVFKHAYLYVVDAEPVSAGAGAGSKSLPKQVIVVSRDLHERAFGGIGLLRRMAAAESDARLDAPDAVLASESTPPSTTTRAAVGTHRGNTCVIQ